LLLGWGAEAKGAARSGLPTKPWNARRLLTRLQLSWLLWLTHHRSQLAGSRAIFTEVVDELPFVVLVAFIVDFDPAPFYLAGHTRDAPCGNLGSASRRGLRTGHGPGLRKQIPDQIGRGVGTRLRWAEPGLLPIRVRIPSRWPRRVGIRWHAAWLGPRVGGNTRNAGERRAWCRWSARGARRTGWLALSRRRGLCGILSEAELRRLILRIAGVGRRLVSVRLNPRNRLLGIGIGSGLGLPTVTWPPPKCGTCLLVSGGFAIQRRAFRDEVVLTLRLLIAFRLVGQGIGEDATRSDMNQAPLVFSG